MKLDLHGADECPSPALVFPELRGMSSRFLRRINDLRPHLVLRVLHEKSAEYAKEIRALDPELILREVPGKSVQWSPHPQRFGWRWLRTPRLDPPRGEVIGIGRSPISLGTCAARRTALVRGASALPCTDPRIRAEPLSAEATRTAAKR